MYSNAKDSGLDGEVLSECAGVGSAAEQGRTYWKHRNREKAEGQSMQILSGRNVDRRAGRGSSAIDRPPNAARARVREKFCLALEKCRCRQWNLMEKDEVIPVIAVGYGKEKLKIVLNRERPI